MFDDWILYLPPQARPVATALAARGAKIIRPAEHRPLIAVEPERPLRLEFAEAHLQAGGVPYDLIHRNSHQVRRLVRYARNGMPVVTEYGSEDACEVLDALIRAGASDRNALSAQLERLFSRFPAAEPLQDCAQRDFTPVPRKLITTLVEDVGRNWGRPSHEQLAALRREAALRAHHPKSASPPASRSDEGPSL